ncbi:hypothetical protein GBA52_017031 [Prunus armeniaca]|nr:hypothetical protein GBA52_017031 [Prunus armeniaca]
MMDVRAMMILMMMLVTLMAILTTVDYSNDAFSDAIDVFSLSEAIDITEKKAQKKHEIS